LSSCNLVQDKRPIGAPADSEESPLKELIQQLEAHLADPQKGLPEDVFLLLSRLSPLINVDLLIRNEQGHILLTWRDDEYYLPGWHIPGGIIRYKETMGQRIEAVALHELGAKVTYHDGPLAIHQIIEPSRKNRGHFISLLFECTLISPLDKTLRYEQGPPLAGQWAWHAYCPHNLIAAHEMYRKFFGTVFHLKG
jgi:colanic acid biosynthesis protein WcaH